MSEQNQRREPSSKAPSDRLNEHCFCVTLDRSALCEAFERETGDAAFCAKLLETHPHLFSEVAVFASAAMFDRMLTVVRAIEAAARFAAYREAVLSWAPEIARYDPGPVGAFMGYDFHLADEGPKLIEINTNAGGAFLTAPLARAQRRCCRDAERAQGHTGAEGFGAAVLRMFEKEWSRQGHSGVPRRVAIVDDDPQMQYLYPEFVLAQRFFEQRGIAVIADGRRLAFDGNTLTFDGQPIELVYNCLVDFALAEPEHSALRSAYLDGAVVVTPNPLAHALFADKRNLTVLCDSARFRELDLGFQESDVLGAGVLRTVIVTPDNAESLWAGRKNLFFTDGRVRQQSRLSR